jgi:hypothetical protein
VRTFYNNPQITDRLYTEAVLTANNIRINDTDKIRRVREKLAK